MATSQMEVERRRWGLARRVALLGAAFATLLGTNVGVAGVDREGEGRAAFHVPPENGEGSEGRSHRVPARVTVADEAGGRVVRVRFSIPGMSGGRTGHCWLAADLSALQGGSLVALGGDSARANYAELDEAGAVRLRAARVEGHVGVASDDHRGETYVALVFRVVALAEDGRVVRRLEEGRVFAATSVVDGHVVSAEGYYEEAGSSCSGSDDSVWVPFPDPAWEPWADEPYDGYSEGADEWDTGESSGTWDTDMDSDGGGWVDENGDSDVEWSWESGNNDDPAGGQDGWSDLWGDNSTPDGGNEDWPDGGDEWGYDDDWSYDSATSDYGPDCGTDLDDGSTDTEATEDIVEFDCEGQAQAAPRLMPTAPGKIHKVDARARGRLRVGPLPLLLLVAIAWAALRRSQREPASAA